MGMTATPHPPSLPQSVSSASLHCCGDLLCCKSPCLTYPVLDSKGLNCEGRHGLGGRSICRAFFYFFGTYSAAKSCPAPAAAVVKPLQPTPKSDLDSEDQHFQAVPFLCTGGGHRNVHVKMHCSFCTHHCNAVGPLETQSTPSDEVQRQSKLATTAAGLYTVIRSITVIRSQQRQHERASCLLIYKSRQRLVVCTSL